MDSSGSRSDGHGAATTITQDGRSIAIDTPLGKDTLILVSVDGQETVSRGYVYQAEFVTKAADTQIRTLLGKAATLWLGNSSPSERRPLHGHVRHLKRMGMDPRGYRMWRAEVVPWMWFLTRSVDCRIYQDKSVPDIIRSVLDEHELSHYRFRLFGEYPKLVFCVQYRETAFDFISRLMEHLGIAYWFEHAADRHTLVMSDDSRTAAYCDQRQVKLADRQDLGEVQWVEQDFTVRSGQWALKDYDFEVPTKNLRTNVSTVLGSPPLSRFEIFDFPGCYTSADEGKRLTRLRMEAEEAVHSQVSGKGNSTGFDAGKRFDLAGDEPDEAGQPRSYYLTDVRHSATDPIDYASAPPPPTYSNRFTGIPADVPFRPERSTHRPVVQGLQTATVVGPAGESIHVDKYGRVRVLFHWDRRGKHGEDASCWIRVSQAVAGSQYGGIAIPHVGHEVIVSFLEGDPDRPLIVGNVHNGGNMPPITLPADKDKTMLRDHGDNKIVMHGKAGKQHLSLVSPRSLNLYAVKSVGKALSADINFFDRNGSFSDPIDTFEDPNSLKELFTLFKAMDDPSNPKFQDTNSPGTTLTSVTSAPTPGAVDAISPSALADTAATCDINSMSEGNINGLSLGNTNAWVYSNSNTWVDQNSNSQVNGSLVALIKGNSTTTIDGTSLTTINSGARSVVTGNNTTIVSEDNITKAPGNYTYASTNVTRAHRNSTFCTGDNNTLVAGINDTVYFGLNMTLGLGLNLTVAPGMAIQLNGFSISNNGFNIATNSIKIHTTDGVDLKTVGFSFLTTALHLIA